jgi:hypothetical protein
VGAVLPGVSGGLGLSRSTAVRGGTQDPPSLPVPAALVGTRAARTGVEPPPWHSLLGRHEQPLVAPQAAQAKHEPARVMTFPHW